MRTTNGRNRPNFYQMKAPLTKTVCASDTGTVHYEQPTALLASCTWNQTLEKHLRTGTQRPFSDHGLQPWLIGCLMATVPPCGSHPTQSPLQMSKNSEETPGLFSLRRGGQEEPAFVCTKILIIFRYNSLNILCTAPTKFEAIHWSEGRHEGYKKREWSRAALGKLVDCRDWKGGR